MTETHSETEQKRNTASRKRSVMTYLVVLFVCAILLLLLAYFTQERSLAQTAAQLVSLR